jgi:sulfatase modifying factor 1
VRGRASSARRDERSPHAVAVAAFCLDRTLATRASFGRFVAATGSVTAAARRGYGVESVEGMLDWEWRRVPHGSWRRPFTTEDADTRGYLRDDAPVVMVSWRDAVAYCGWRRGRLPTEEEWEYAMRAGARGTRFPWGDAIDGPDGGARLNRWEGASHARNDRRDGYVYVSPVRAFAPNAWGFYDPAGNVWQWTADAFEGRPSEVDAGEASPDQRVLRGGSWWCAACTCEGYGLWYRGHAAARAAFSNNGFRCAYAPAR